MPTALLIDCSYLCYRAHYTLDFLTNGEDPTGILFGFLRDLQRLETRFQADRIGFCFDSHRKDCKRRELRPTYKAHRHIARKDELEEEKELRGRFIQQITALRKKYLPELGYKNILYQDGYEADDLIASLVQTIPKNVYKVIVSADSDLFQLLRPNVVQYNASTKVVFSHRMFKEKYGIRPSMWADVKSIAGCTTDNVKGIRGAGEITAIRYLLGNLSPATKIYKTLNTKKSRRTIRQNRKLVTLPFPGTARHLLKKDTSTPRQWTTLLESLGMKSLIQEIIQ